MKRLLFFFASLLFFALPSIGQLPAYLPTNGLIAYYPFNGTASDESGNGLHGTVLNASLTFDRFYQPNSAFAFNGTSGKITVADNAVLNPSYLTISLWFQTNDTVTTRYLLYKANWNDAANEEYAAGINFLVPGQSVGAVKTASSCQPGIGWKRTFASLRNTQWNHYVFTYDGTNSKVYVNGNLVATNNAASGPIDVCSGGTLTIGAGWSVDPGWWNGKIDDVLLYNRALTEDEITTLYLNQGAIVPGNAGVNLVNPQRNLHVKDVLRLEPRSAPPINPAEGDMYYDATLKKLRVFDGSTWQNCW